MGSGEARGSVVDATSWLTFLLVASPFRRAPVRLPSRSAIACCAGWTAIQQVDRRTAATKGVPPGRTDSRDCVLVPRTPAELSANHPVRTRS